MKNKTFKIVALLLVATVGLFVLSKSKKSQENKLTLSDESSKNIEEQIATTSSEKPLSFSQKTGNSEVFLTFTYNGKDFTKQLTGPTVRCVPSSITKEEFIEAYNAYLL